MKRWGRNIVLGLVLALVVLTLLSATVGIGVGRRAVLGELLPSWVGLLFLTIAIAVLSGLLTLGRPDKPKKAARVVFGLACGILGLAGLARTYIGAQGRADFRQFVGQEATRLQIGCRTLSSPSEVGGVMSALRGAEAFSDRTRWQTPLHLTIQLRSGEERDFALASDLYQGRVVVASGSGATVAVPGLMGALEQAGAARRVSRWDPSAGRNIDSIVPDDTCTQSNPR